MPNEAEKWYHYELKRLDLEVRRSKFNAQITAIQHQLAELDVEQATLLREHHRDAGHDHVMAVANPPSWWQILVNTVRFPVRLRS